MSEIIIVSAVLIIAGLFIRYIDGGGDVEKPVNVTIGAMIIVAFLGCAALGGVI